MPDTDTTTMSPRTSALEDIIREALSATIFGGKSPGPTRAARRISDAEAAEPETVSALYIEPDPVSLRREVLNNVTMICEIEGNIEALAQRKRDIDGRMSSAKKAAEALRRDTCSLIASNGGNKIKDPEVTVSIMRLKDKLTCEITADALEHSHPEWVRTSKSIDQTKVNEHYKFTGEIPDGFDVVEGGYTLTIRH